MSIFNSNLRDDLRNRIDELEQELAKLKEENESKNKTIKYLESFIKFCKCGNPEGDCIC